MDQSDAPGYRFMNKWIRSIRQTTTYLGLAVVVVIWSGILLLSDQEHGRAYDDALRQGNNLTLVLEEYVQRIILQYDNVLLALRRDYGNNPQHFDLPTWSKNTQFHSSLTANIGITDANGYVILSSLRHLSSPVYVGDREPFLFQQKSSKSDQLFISDPLIGGVSKEPSIQLTRPINSPDGRFIGTVAIALNVAELEKFFGSLNLGNGGIVSLVHSDGVVLVRGGSSPEARSFIGTKLDDSPLFAELKKSAAGSYWNSAATSSQFEGIKRLISYRAVPGLPLVAVAGRSEETIFHQADASHEKYVVIGTVLTIAILFVVLMAAHRQAQMLSTSDELHQSKESLEQANRVLDETKRFLHSIIENIPVSVVVKDAATRKYVLVNRAFESMVEMPRCDLLGRTVFEIFNAEDAKFMDRTDSEAAQTVNDTHYKEYEVEGPKGGQRIQATRRIVLRDEGGGPKYLIAMIDDITERKKVEHRIAYLAHHDGLTGLVNRTALLQRIEEAGGRSRRSGEAFSVLLLDLDRFKQVNDSMGHPVGDRLLCEVASRLKGLLRETDVLARLGGDEFAIIQAGDAGSERAAAALAGRVIACIGQPFVIDGVEITVGTSIGIAFAPEHQGASDELLKMADLALYRAKAAGRNGFCFFDPQMSAVASARQQIESDLRRAIQQNELEVHYQPIIDCKTGKISSTEALVRWRHPVKGLIYPDSFIPIAEETGLIGLIGDRVLRAACTQAAAWPTDVRVAVNLSVIQIQKPNCVAVVMLALAESGLSPERLEIEITETALIKSAAECLPALRQFKDLGITIVLDDFGTGYSSLSQLAMFPFNRIKIDKSFTQNMTKRSECAAIISATLTLAQSLDIATTAEGVETADQYRLLQLSGVTSLQGYFFQRPVPATEIDFNSCYCGAVVEDAA